MNLFAKVSLYLPHIVEMHLQLQNGNLTNIFPMQTTSIASPERTSGWRQEKTCAFICLTLTHIHHSSADWTFRISFCSLQTLSSMHTHLSGRHTTFCSHNLLDKRHFNPPTHSSSLFVSSSHFLLHKSGEPVVFCSTPLSSKERWWWWLAMWTDRYSMVTRRRQE